MAEIMSLVIAGEIVSIAADMIMLLPAGACFVVWWFVVESGQG